MKFFPNRNLNKLMRELQELFSTLDVYFPLEDEPKELEKRTNGVYFSKWIVYNGNTTLNVRFYFENNNARKERYDILSGEFTMDLTQNHKPEEKYQFHSKGQLQEQLRQKLEENALKSVFNRKKGLVFTQRFVEKAKNHAKTQGYAFSEEMLLNELKRVLDKPTDAELEITLRTWNPWDFHYKSKKMTIVNKDNRQIKTLLYLKMFPYGAKID